MRLGVGEILVVLALALLFFGPSKLPQLGASLGQALKSFKKGLNSLHDETDVSAAVHEEPKEVPPGKVLAIVKQFTETERYSPRILKSSPTRGGGQTIGLVILNHQHLVYAT